MSLSSTIDRIIADWEKPGLHLIVSDRNATNSFWQRLRARQVRSSISMAPNTVSNCAGWIGQLSQSFLGSQMVYWIEIPTPWAPKAKKEALSFLNKYQGPHALWIVLDEELVKELRGSGVDRYVVPAAIKVAHMPSLAPLLGVARATQVLLRAGITRLPGNLSLDAACSVVLHAEYVPMRTPESTQSYLARLMPYEGSLLNLSDLFFQRKWTAFLDAWQQIAGSYSDMFWVAFWTDQCWRAYWTCFYLKNGQHTRARALSYRLPASFVRSIWQQQEPQLLLNLFSKLSFFDTRVKKGSLFALNELLTTAMNAI